MTGPVLVAGFEPFGGARSNPSADAVRRLASTWAGPEPLVTTVLPVTFADARIPDNAGAQPLDVPVVAGGPAAYFSTLPVKAITAALVEGGHPAALSHSAGTFVCNHVFYALLHHLDKLAGGDPPPAGFVHLPPATVLPVVVQADALRIVVRTALDIPRDLPLRGGALA